MFTQKVVQISGSTSRENLRQQKIAATNNRAVFIPSLLIAGSDWQFASFNPDPGRLVRKGKLIAYNPNNVICLTSVIDGEARMGLLSAGIGRSVAVCSALLLSFVVQGQSRPVKSEVAIRQQTVQVALAKAEAIAEMCEVSCSGWCCNGCASIPAD